jgi:hypothetical protein
MNVPFDTFSSAQFVFCTLADDRAQERERIREKHLKRRLKDRGDRTEEVGVSLGGATLGSYVPEEDDESEDGSSTGSAGSGEDDSGSERSGDDEEEDGSEDESSGESEETEPRRGKAKPMSLQEQEQAVLAMLQGRKK